MMIPDKIDNWNTIGQIFRLDIPQAQRHLLHALLYYAGRNNRAFPSLGTITESTGIQKRSLQTHLRALEQAGLIAREVNAGPGGANLYRFTDKLVQPEAIEAVEPTEQPSEPEQSAKPDPMQILLPPCKSCHPVPAKVASPPLQTLPPKRVKEHITKTRVTRGLDSGLSWKALDADDMLRIIKAPTADEWRRWDDEGIRAFGWPDTDVARINRLCLWVASIRYARKNGGNAAALLVAALKGKRDFVVSQADEDTARAKLAKRSIQPTVLPMMKADFGAGERSQGDQFRALAMMVHR